ncbi:MAG: PAS domain S-box protein, partial [Balneolaceae bacterium]|nr:PAS domain S-box protein [Balneolaceae bacterium]
MMKASPYKRLNIDRKLIGILSLFAVLGTCLVIIIVVATNSLSALRSYSTMQTHWTEHRKEVTYQIIKYVETGAQTHLDKYRDGMALIKNVTDVRAELFKDDTDRDVVRNNLMKAHLLPTEIDGMITTFKRFKGFRDFQIAIYNWQKSDSLIYLYQTIINQVKPFGNGNSSQAEVASTVARIEAIDHELTQVQYDLAAALTRGTGFLNRVIFWVAFSLGGLFLVISSILTFRFSKSIKGWHRQMSMSEQRYRSLFEQNPYAVFSLNENGEVHEGNQTFTQIFGNTYLKPGTTHLADLIADQQNEEVHALLKRVQHEKSLSFTTSFRKNATETLQLHVMLMPIFVDDKITGIFGVAEDVTYQKEAENKIKQQLEEKTILLAEIHHRVKNNLAVISGLLELQQDMLTQIPAIEALEDAKGRIKSMAMIHEQIYQNEDLANINFGNYIKELSSRIAASFDTADKSIMLHIDAGNITITLDQIIPCGLILNELICNAYKYAFEGRTEGNIWISVKNETGNQIRLTVADDGVGMPENWQENDSKTLGLMLVQILTRQLNGTFAMK